MAGILNISVNSQSTNGCVPSTEMQSSLDSLSQELHILREYICSLESKLTPVLRPVEEPKTGSAVSGLGPVAPLIHQLQNARNQVMEMSSRIEKLRENLVV